MAETNVADALVEYLSSRGVQNIFGVLAHTSFAIGDAIAKRPHMRFVNAQHEGGAERRGPDPRRDPSRRGASRRRPTGTCGGHP